jgi:phage-related baseplate assembly protein
METWCAPGKACPTTRQRTEPAPVVDAGIQQRCPAALQTLGGAGAGLDRRQVWWRLRSAASGRIQDTRLVAPAVMDIIVAVWQRHR